MVSRLASTWAAVRYRRSQSIALVLVSALVTTCAVFAPMFVRTLEQGLLRARLVERDVADTTVLLRAVRTTADPSTTPGDIATAMPSGALRWFGDRVGMTTADTSVQPREGLQRSPLRLVARDDICDHLELTSGKCPQLPREVLVSAADAKAWGWKEGQVFDVPDPSVLPGEPSSEVPLTVVGVYRTKPDPGYWLRTQIDGKSGFPLAQGLSIVPAVDDFVTDESTFDDGWGQAQISVEYPLDRSRVSLTTVPEISTALSGLSDAKEGVAVSTPLPDLVASIDSGRAIVRTLVPLLLAQLALLAITVLVLVANAAVEQRRPEVALARLRGRSREGGSRVVMAELTLTVLLGVPLGVGVALLIGELLRRTLMPAGVPLELRWPLVIAVAVAVVGCLVAVYLAARPVLREPVASLLRRVPPATGRVLGMLDVVVVVVAVLALVGLVSGDVKGPSALLVPVLLALAVGLLGAALLRRVAAGTGRRALSKGRLAQGIAALSLARRPSLRNVLVVVTTATALATFAVNAVVVGAENRTARAELETGAPAVIETDATNPTTLAAVVDALPAAQRAVATPVVVIRPRDSSAVPTLLARPAELSRIGYAVPDDLAALTPPVVPSVQLADGTITGTLAWTLTNFRSAEEPAGTAPQSPTGIPGGDLSVAPEPLTVGITVTTPDGESLDRDLGEVPQTAKGQVPIDAKVLCPDGCRLAALWLRGTDQFTDVIAGHLDLTDLELDGAPLDIGDGASWLPVETPTTDGTQVLSGAGNDLGIDFTNTGRRVVSRWGDVPDPMPVVLAGRPPVDADGDDFTLIGLGGRPVASRAVQHVDALPALTNHGALADLDAQLRVGGEVGPGSALQVWLGTESPDVIREVSAALTAGGLPVTSTTTVTEARAQYDRSATGWGLLLGVFTGVMALLVSCLVVGLVAVTSWRGVARDLAGLLVAGTPRTVLRSAVRREQLTTVVAGVLLGTLCGVAGAVLAMPLLPLFDRPAAVPVPDLTPAWLAIGATALLALLLVGGVALLAARGVVARAVPERLRESL